MTKSKIDTGSHPIELDKNELDRVQGGDNEHKDWIIIESMSSPLFTRTAEGDSTFKTTRQD